MAQAPRKRNPFRPGAGSVPPVLSGRDAELSRAREVLDALGAGDPPPEGMLLFGPRGNGKTVLLARIADEARTRGLRAERLPVSAFRDHTALGDELREIAGLSGPHFRGAQAAGFGFGVEPGSPPRNLLRLLTEWIGADGRPLVILLDEVHTVTAAVGRDFFDAAQEATTRTLPFWLLAAGTPDAPRRLREAGTFTERMFEAVPVGRLERDATLRALTRPASDTGQPLHDGAAALLAAASQDYPYFIQLLGSAAWQVARDDGGREITEQAARQGIEAAQPRVDRFYAQRFHEARGRGIHRTLAPLAALVSERGGRLDEADLDAFLAGAPRAVGEAELLNTLTDLGVLWETPPAGWEMGIPSFADFVLQHHATDPGARG